MKREHTVALFIVIFTVGFVFAGPDFSGEWKLDKDQSDFGQMPAPNALTFSINDSEPNIANKWGYDGE